MIEPKFLQINAQEIRFIVLHGLFFDIARDLSQKHPNFMKKIGRCVVCLCVTCNEEPSIDETPALENRGSNFHLMNNNQKTLTTKTR